MEISKILIACYKKDFWLTKVCVASIRYWYPDIPIALIVDELNGNFNTRSLEKKYDLTRFPLSMKRFGWGISKLEPLFLSGSNERFLIIDSDIIFIGPVLERLNSSIADFIVSPEYSDENLQSNWMKITYYYYDKLVVYDANFKFPGFTFNSGQFVANAGALSRSDFKDLIDYSSSGTEAPKLLRNDIFQSPDQGMLNYLLNKKAQEGHLTIDKENFMIWSGDAVALEQLKLEVIKSKQGYPFLIHYAGRGKKPINKFDRSDIFLFFLKLYYFSEPLGFVKLFFLHLRMNYKHARVSPSLGKIKNIILSKMKYSYSY